LSTLKDKAVKGVMWSAIERFGNQGIQFVIGLILARLLMPEDYGLIGMLLVFISVAQVFVEGGFSSALIRKAEPTRTDYSTVFWFNLTMAFVFYAIIFFCSPFIAAFYDQPLLEPLARLTGMTIIISAFGIIQRTILTKRLDFKSQAKLNISAIVISGLVGVICAWSGFGVWALAVQSLTRAVLVNAGFWFLSSWRPDVIFSRTSFKELFGFGSRLLISALINAVSENLYSIIIGKLYNVKSLGYYTRANQFQKLPVSSIYGAIAAVTYPVLSELRDDKEKLRGAYRSMIRMVAFVLFPVMAILGIVAEPMVRIILTDKWLPCVPLLQILCIVGAFYPLHAINLDILKVKGRSDLFLKLEIIKQLLNVTMILICFRWGVYGLVWGSVALNVVCYYINSFYSKVIVGYGIMNQVADLFSISVLSFVMMAILFGVSLVLPNDLLRLCILPVLGLGSYILVCRLAKVEELSGIQEMVSVISKKLKPHRI
jgi:teichuronic acid exporter